MHRVLANGAFYAYMQTRVLLVQVQLCWVLWLELQASEAAKRH